MNYHIFFSNYKYSNKMDPTGIIGIIACGCKALKLTYDELIKYEVGIKTSDEKIIEDL